jgi:membrane fusion protein (multidrug efflux system)
MRMRPLAVTMPLCNPPGSKSLARRHRLAWPDAQVKAAHAQVQQAQEAVQQAELNLSYTKIVSPTDGQVAQRTVESGNRVQPGQALMAISEPDVWVVTNLKETQLEKVRVGQPVAIRIDSFPHQKFSGWVDSVQPGSGATYSLLPYGKLHQNCTARPGEDRF